MRILIVSHSSQTTGGAELALCESARALQRRHLVKVIVRRRGPLESLLTSQGTACDRATYAYWLGKRGPLGAARVRRTMGSALGFPALLSKVKAFAPDVVVTNTIAVGTGAVAAQLLGIPHVWYVHEFGARDGEVAFDFGFAATRALLNRSAMVVANSAAVARYYASKGVTSPMKVVPNAVCVRDVQRTAAARSTLDLIMVGHISPGKRQADAVRALGIVRRKGINARLMLLGTEDAAYGRTLRRVVSDEGLEEFVELLGFVSSPEDRIASADIALSCSAEGFGRVTVEAMKLGCAVVGANRDATRELIADGETGLLYPPGDVEALADRISALASPTLRERLITNARAYALARFNLDRHGAELEAALHSLGIAAVG